MSAAVSRSRGVARYAPPFRMPAPRPNGEWQAIAGLCLAQLVRAPTKRTVMERWNDLGDVVCSWQRATGTMFFVGPTTPAEWRDWLARILAEHDPRARV